MSTIPLSIAKYIRAWWMSELILTYIHIDREGLLAGWGGHPRHYGFPPLITGKPAIEQIPFLEGLLPVQHTEVLEFVQLERGRAAHIHLIPFHGGTWVLLFDATAEHDRQQKIQQQLNELSLLNYRQSCLVQELETARQALQGEKQRLEKAESVKSQFIAGLSHELRAPLTSIVGYTNLLNQIQQVDQQESEYLSSVRSNASHLLALIDNILDQTRLETGQVLLQPANCNIKQLVTDIRALFFPLTREKELTLEMQTSDNLPALLVVDELRFRQVLINLLNNALKFTQQGFIRLRLSWQEDRLIFEVTDSGPGITPASLEKIFMPYHREKEARTRQGVGLGLAITSQLVELMGGQIKVSSTLGKGSVFSGFVKAITAVKLTAEQTAETTIPPETAAREKGKKVLIAEDTLVIRVLMENYLQESGYIVFSASDGEEAVKLAESVQPDLVLMDMLMPQMDGYTAVQTLRAIGFTKPIIALSASSVTEDKEAAFQAGCDEYLLKPVSLEALLDTVAQMLH